MVSWIYQISFLRSFITVTSEKLEKTLLNKFIVLILPKLCAVRIF